MQIELKRQGDLGLGGSAVLLCHGMNEVPEEAWERVADDEITQWYVDQGLVVVHDGAAVESPPAEPSQAPEEEPNAAEPPPADSAVGGPEVSDEAPPGSESKPPGQPPPDEPKTPEPAPPSRPAQPPKVHQHANSGRRKGRRFGR